MPVFSHTDEHTELDLFIFTPFDFGAAWNKRLESDIGDGILAPFVDLRRLIGLKRQAGRTKDLEDIRVLEEIGDEPTGA